MSGRSTSWFWIGAGLGLVLSAGAVVIASEFTEIRRRRRREPGFEQGESDLVEDLSLAVHEGLHVLSQAAAGIGQTFADLRREVIRYNLDPSMEGHSAGASGWYAGDEDY